MIGKGNRTFFGVTESDGSSQLMEFTTKMGINGLYFVWAPMAIEAPLARIGEKFVGEMRSVVLKGSA